MTVSADFAEVVPQENVDQMILGANLALPTLVALAWSKPVGPGKGNTVNIPTRTSLAVPAGTKAENADFTLVSQSTDEATLTGGYIGLADEVSSELAYDAMIDAVGDVITNAVEHLRDRVDADGAALLATTANDSDFTAEAGGLGDDNMLTALAAFVNQQPNKSAAGWGFVGNAAQFRDMNLDLRAAGGAQLGGDAESERVAQMMGMREGYMGVRHKMQYFLSTNVDVTGGNASGAIMTLGSSGALAYRVWEPINVETRRLPRGKKWELTIACRVGWGLSKQSNIRGVQSAGT